MIKGTRTLVEFQGYDTPPEVSPTKNNVVAEVKTDIPNQSNIAIFFVKEEVSWCKCRQNPSPIRDGTHIGILIQKIQRQVVYVPMAPPIGILL